MVVIKFLEFWFRGSKLPPILLDTAYVQIYSWAAYGFDLNFSVPFYDSLFFDTIARVQNKECCLEKDDDSPSKMNFARIMWSVGNARRDCLFAFPKTNIDVSVVVQIGFFDFALDQFSYLRMENFASVAEIRFLVLDSECRKKRGNVKKICSSSDSIHKINKIFIVF